MISPLLRKLDPVEIIFPNGEIMFNHPTLKDLEFIAIILNEENLDVRRISMISQLRFPVVQKEVIVDRWTEEIQKYISRFPEDVLIVKQIQNQSEALQRYSLVPDEGSIIQDPFCMKEVEQAVDIKELAKQQLGNIIIGKLNDIIVVFGRLLEVEGSVELVSVWTRPEFRKQGLANKVIELLLTHAVTFPIYSFQKVSLVHYYLTRYNKYKHAEVAEFSQIPKSLQRDLFYMNFFWGPYSIIRTDI